MNGVVLSCRCLDLFRFDVERLSDFVEAAFLQAAVAGDVRCDLNFLPVRIGLNVRVETGGGSEHLDVKGAGEKERSPGKRPAQARPSTREISRSANKSPTRDYPPKGGPPPPGSGEDAQRVGHGCPEHGLARCLEAEWWGDRSSDVCSSDPPLLSMSTSPPRVVDHPSASSIRIRL